MKKCPQRDQQNKKQNNWTRQSGPGWDPPAPGPLGPGLLARMFARWTGPEVKGIPKCFFGQVVFWRPGVPRPNNHTFSGKDLFVGHAAEGGKAKQHLFS